MVSTKQWQYVIRGVKAAGRGARKTVEAFKDIKAGATAIPMERDIHGGFSKVRGAKGFAQRVTGGMGYIGRSAAKMKPYPSTMKKVKHLAAAAAGAHVGIQATRAEQAHLDKKHPEEGPRPNWLKNVELGIGAAAGAYAGNRAYIAGSKAYRIGSSTFSSPFKTRLDKAAKLGSMALGGTASGLAMHERQHAAAKKGAFRHTLGDSLKIAEAAAGGAAAGALAYSGAKFAGVRMAKKGISKPALGLATGLGLAGGTLGAYSIHKDRRKGKKGTLKRGVMAARGALVGGAFGGAVGMLPDFVVDAFNPAPPPGPRGQQYRRVTPKGYIG